MNLWIGDYLKLRNEIHYLKFKLTDSKLSETEVEDTEDLLNERLEREGKFVLIINSFTDISNQILKKKYIEGKSLYDTASDLGYSHSHVAKKHAEAIIFIKKFERLRTELEQFNKNFPRKRNKQ